jgi:hypothetical protein
VLRFSRYDFVVDAAGAGAVNSDDGNLL